MRCIVGAECCRARATPVRSVDSLSQYSGPAGVTTTTTYDYSGTRLNALDATRSDNTTYSIDYLYGDDGAVFAGAYRGSDATAGVPFMLVTTDRGDVRELLDASGNSFAFYAYDTYGNPDTTRSASATTALVPSATVAAAIAARQPLRYASYAFDSESGLYYCSARYYDPATFAFISRDPVKADAEESLYQYCGGDPVNHVDPNGQAIKDSDEGGLTAEDTAATNEELASKHPHSKAYERARAHYKKVYYSKAAKKRRADRDKGVKKAVAQHVLKQRLAILDSRLDAATNENLAQLYDYEAAQYYLGSTRCFLLAAGIGEAITLGLDTPATVRAFQEEQVAEAQVEAEAEGVVAPSAQRAASTTWGRTVQSFRSDRSGWTFKSVDWEPSRSIRGGLSVEEHWRSEDGVDLYRHSLFDSEGNEVLRGGHPTYREYPKMAGNE